MRSSHNRISQRSIQTRADNAEDRGPVAVDQERAPVSGVSFSKRCKRRYCAAVLWRSDNERFVDSTNKLEYFRLLTQFLVNKNRKARRLFTVRDVDCGMPVRKAVGFGFGASLASAVVLASFLLFLFGFQFFNFRKNLKSFKNCFLCLFDFLLFSESFSPQLAAMLSTRQTTWRRRNGNLWAKTDCYFETVVEDKNQRKVQQSSPNGAFCFEISLPCTHHDEKVS